MVHRLLPYFLVFIRVVVGFLFIAASIDKISSPDAFAEAIGNYRIIPAVAVLPAATVLPWIELLCGLALVLGFWTRGSALLISVLLVAFTFAVISALVRGLDISCGCFTLDPTAQRVGWSKIGENMLLLGATCAVLFVKNDQSFLSFPSRGHAEGH
ncbi:MAG: DoxX family membrane protein [Ignavibacteria bacterium]|nr:DoxX family membrane protein [Ignavibacteria bacterium]